MMRYLYPAGGAIPDGFYGVLVQPSKYDIGEAKNGEIWAADNGAYAGFDERKYLHMLNKLAPFADKCLFVVVPDVVGDARKTINLFDEWHTRINYPLAFVAQDGQENLELPDTALWSTLFIGGSTNFKMSDAAIDLINDAVTLGKHVHIGRVNTWRRYSHFRSIHGSEGFTCDGTRIRFERDKAIRDWQKYMDAPRQLRIPISNGDCDG